jgi:hypothetical protein
MTTRVVRPANCRPSGSNPETGLAEINSDLLEADLRPASLRVHPGHYFRSARHPTGTKEMRTHGCFWKTSEEEMKTTGCFAAHLSQGTT